MFVVSAFTNSSNARLAPGAMCVLYGLMNASAPGKKGMTLEQLVAGCFPTMQNEAAAALVQSNISIIRTEVIAVSNTDGFYRLDAPFKCDLHDWQSVYHELNKKRKKNIGRMVEPWMINRHTQLFEGADYPWLEPVRAEFNLQVAGILTDNAKIAIKRKKLIGALRLCKLALMYDSQNEMAKALRGQLEAKT